MMGQRNKYMGSIFNPCFKERLGARWAKSSVLLILYEANSELSCQLGWNCNTH